MKLDLVLCGAPCAFCRSREGAWIEIPLSDVIDLTFSRRSREGAWIEIPLLTLVYTIGVRRSREGAWIEIRGLIKACSVPMVAPARERGLKCKEPSARPESAGSLPRGSVD